MNGYNSYKANHLVADGANISYYSTRTPISLMKMLDGVTLNYPVVCMSGAALYDTKSLSIYMFLTWKMMWLMNLTLFLKRKTFHHFII